MHGKVRTLRGSFLVSLKSVKSGPDFLASTYVVVPATSGFIRSCFFTLTHQSYSKFGCKIFVVKLKKIMVQVRVTLCYKTFHSCCADQDI